VDGKKKAASSRSFSHGGNPVTRWMAANVAVAQDPAGNLKPAKDKSTERIDGIVATIMALGRAMLPEEPAFTSVYESRGLLILGLGDPAP
jgi:phage terminase large subunit-like protein